MKRLVLAIVSLTLAGALASPALGQNLPPPGAYQPIPNYTGVGAGLQFREAINARFSGAQPIAPLIVATTFANLPSEQDGMLLYCQDCAANNPCAGGGGGAWALGARGQWNCAAGSGGLAMPYTGPVEMTGSSTSGADALNQVNVNGVRNPADYGVISGSLNTISVTIAAGSTAATLAAAGDVQNGEGIAIPGAGPTPSISAPSGTTVAATCSGTCATAYTYQIVALDGACGATAASSATSSVNNASTLSESNFNKLTIPIGAGDKALLIYRGTTPVAIIPASEENASNSSPAAYYRDIGNSITITSPCLASTPPSSAEPDALYATIVSGAGTTSLTLANAATTSVSSQATYHDDAGALMAALTPTNYSTGVKVAIPPNVTIAISRPVVVGGGTVNAGIQINGGAYSSIAATAMMQGMSAIFGENTFQMRTSSLNVTGSPLCAVEHNVNSPSGGVGGAYVGESEDADANFSSGSPLYGICYTAAAGYDQNNSENHIRNLNGTATNAAIYIGHVNPLQNDIYGGNFAGLNEGAVELHGGSFHMLGSVPNSNNWLFDFEAGTYTHHSSATGVTTESGSSPLYMDTNASFGTGMGITITGSDLDGDSSKTGGLAIDVASTSAAIRLMGDRLQDGGVSPNITFDGTAAVIAYSWSGAGTIVNGSGTMSIWETGFGSGSPTITNSGTFNGAHNYGGGISDASAVNQQTNLALESVVMNTGAGSLFVNNPANTKNDFTFSDNGGGTPYLQTTGIIDPAIMQFQTIYSGSGSSAAPSCSSGTQHERVCVSDAGACTSGTTYVTGGSVACELWCNGTSWIESGSGC